MSSENYRGVIPAMEHDDATNEMAKYRITRVPKDYFHYKEYRYTSLDDAIAQAKREHAAASPNGRERSGSR